MSFLVPPKRVFVGSTPTSPFVVWTRQGVKYPMTRFGHAYVLGGLVLPTQLVSPPPPQPLAHRPIVCWRPQAAFFEVLIDGAAMKTNSHNRLQLPSQGLAMAIAAEFAVQTDVILPASTPLVSTLCLVSCGGINTLIVDVCCGGRHQYNLASTAIDRFPEEEEALSSRLVDFLETDSVWCVVIYVVIEPLCCQ